MPISYGTYEKQLKLLPLTLNIDGTASVTIRLGFIENNEFVTTSASVFNMSAQEVSSALDAPPVIGLSRRDDLSLAIYSHLVAVGLVPPGTVS